MFHCHPVKAAHITYLDLLYSKFVFCNGSANQRIFTHIWCTCFWGKKWSLVVGIFFCMRRQNFATSYRKRHVLWHPSKYSWMKWRQQRNYCSLENMLVVGQSKNIELGTKRSIPLWNASSKCQYFIKFYNHNYIFWKL